MMRPPQPADLCRVRELAEFALLDAALDVSARSLRHEHPAVAFWPQPNGPGSVRVARRPVAKILRLRNEIRRYRGRLPRDPRFDDYPF